MVCAADGCGKAVPPETQLSHRNGEHEPRRGANPPSNPARDTDEYRRIQESRLMAAPVFTVDNLADHATAYRARIEQRRIAIESRPREKRFALAEPPPESKEFVKAMLASASLIETHIRDGMPNFFRRPSI